MIYQIGEEVEVLFQGMIKKVELMYDGKIKYTVETDREICFVFENNVRKLLKPEDVKEVKE